MLLYRGICIVADAPCAGTGHCAAVCSTMVSDTMQARDEWDVGVKPLQDVLWLWTVFREISVSSLSLAAEFNF